MKARKTYTPPSVMDRRMERLANELDGWFEVRLARLESYLRTRWPALARWLVG
jgi:hypothetical protein